MVSAFQPSKLGLAAAVAALRQQQASPRVSLSLKKDDATTLTHMADPYETEDEEVKMNCIGGVASYNFSDDDSYDFSDDDESRADEMRRPCSPTLPVFSKNRVDQSYYIKCPRPMKLSPLTFNQQTAWTDEEEEDDDLSVTSLSSTDGEEQEEMTSVPIKLRLDSVTSGDDEEYESGSESEDEEDDEDESDNEEDEEEQDDNAVIVPRERAPVPDPLSQSSHRSETRMSGAAVLIEDEMGHNSDLESLIGDSPCEDEDEDIAAESSGLDRSISHNMPLVGESEEDEQEYSHSPLRHKRQLEEAAISDENEPEESAKQETKRQRSEASTPPLMILPELTIGPTAFSFDAVAGRFPSSVSPTSSSEGSEMHPGVRQSFHQDHQLSEELLVTDDERSMATGNNTPVPLLTPPGSPVRVRSSDGFTTLCEWPSNLTVDNAMVAALQMRPPSPSLLQQLERDFSDDEERRPLSMNKSTTGMTPLLNGMVVNHM